MPVRPTCVVLARRVVAGSLALAATSPALAQRVEAEAAALLEGVEVFAHAGASGGARVRNFDSEGDRLVFANVAPARRLVIGHSLSRPAWRQCSLYMDGVDVATLRFSPTEDWNRYETRAWEIDVAGTVELRLDADDLAANHGETSVAFDYVEFLPLAPESSVVQRDALDRLVYQPHEDAYGDHFAIDFSTCGWGFGARELPSRDWCPVMAVVSPPGAGVDAGPLIQAAIDAVSAMPLNDHGFRGAVLLEPGEFEVPGTLSINASGVVLRGSGEEGASRTTLTGTGPGQRTLLTIAGTGFFGEVGGTSRAIIDAHVPTGATSLNVSDASGFAAGDRVIVYRNSPQTWIDEIGMTTIPTWTPGAMDHRFDRRVVAVQGTRLHLDAPIGNAITASIDGGRVYRYNYGSPGRIRNSGVEDLRARSSFTSPTDEDHCWDFVAFDDAEHCFARDIVAEHFGFGVTRMLTGAKNVTVQDVASRDMVSIVTGGRRYPFVLERGQLVLFRRCYSEEGRHDFVSQSVVPGPNAFVDGRANNALNDTGPHQRWACGTLLDNVWVSGNAINFRDRGISGTGHGWAGANQMAWNARANSYIIEQPPTAQNWSIGGAGGAHTGDGFIESPGAAVSPQSLHEAQLAERLRRDLPGAFLYDSLTDVVFPTVTAAPGRIVTIRSFFSVDALGAVASPATTTLRTEDSSTALSVEVSPDPAAPFLVARVTTPGGSGALTCADGVREFLGAGDYEVVAQFEVHGDRTELRAWIYRTDIDALVWRGAGAAAVAPSALLARHEEQSAPGISEMRSHIHAARVIAVPADGDAVVDEAAPTTNFGGETQLALRRGFSGDAAEANLVFRPEIEDEVIVGLRLRVRSTGLEGGLKLFDVAPRPWLESGVTWQNRMLRAGALDRAATIRAGDEVVLDASAATRVDGRVLLVLANDREDAGMTLASREAAEGGPVLEVIVEDRPGSATAWRITGAAGR